MVSINSLEPTVEVSRTSTGLEPPAQQHLPDLFIHFESQQGSAGMAGPAGVHWDNLKKKNTEGGNKQPTGVKSGWWYQPSENMSQ